MVIFVVIFHGCVIVGMKLMLESMQNNNDWDLNGNKQF